MNEATLSADTAQVAVGGRDLATGERIGWESPGFGSDTPAYTASIAKLFIAEAYMLHAADAGAPLTPNETANLAAMLTASDNAAADVLYTSLGEDTMRACLARLGLTDTELGDDDAWGLSTTTVDDFMVLLDNLTSSGGPLPPATQTQLRGWLGNVALDQRWGIGEVGDDAEMKDGWLPLGDEDGWVINSVGSVTADDGHRLNLVVLSTGWETKDEGTEACTDLARNLVDVLGR